MIQKLIKKIILYLRKNWCYIEQEELGIASFGMCCGYDGNYLCSKCNHYTKVDKKLQKKVRKELNK